MWWERLTYSGTRAGELQELGEDEAEDGEVEEGVNAHDGADSSEQHVLVGDGLRHRKIS